LTPCARLRALLENTAMSPFQVIVLATPVFFLLMGIEFAYGYVRERKGTGRNTYRLNDAVNSISLGVLSQLSAIFSKLVFLAIYTAIYNYAALFPNEAFWGTWYGALLALLLYDFCYYWLHRAGHEVAILWAAHVVHHQSQDYNLSTALRQTSSGELLAWVFYVPMALLGVPPLVFAIEALVDLLYQFWVHTEHIPKLGWFDRVFCSPSNHRVHHAVNDRYLDRNYGGILVLWDRLFGSFQEEDEKCVYGTRGQLNSWDPLWANLEVYRELAVVSWRARNWGDKLKVWLKPPGWQPADVAARYPKPAFDIRQVQVFHPPMSRAAQWFVAGQFVVLLQGVTAILWNAHQLPALDCTVWSTALVAAYWAMGAVAQSRITMTGALMVESAALAVAASTLNLHELYVVCKPLTLLLALVYVAKLDFGASARPFRALLMAALGACLLGDVLLLQPQLFMAGLAAFLVGHLAFIALFRQGAPWFPSRPALGLTLAFGIAMYGLLWNTLHDPMLKAAVGAYVAVISLMAAQAIGRAVVMKDGASLWVAVGACAFMLSDTLLAINKFMQPLPLAALWILGTYYVAQLLIVLHARPLLAGASQPSAIQPNFQPVTPA
jgi:sterol desaturase/sphingolipid hydroxylase (fatty acid hydroxylase superfamily)/uncharacterized membrane protein YhhN